MANQEGKKRTFIEFWKHLLFYNVGIKLLSVACAVIFWLMISNIADPYKTKNFIVNVSTVHEEAISSAHQVYEVVDGKTATVSVHGRRSVVDKLDESDITATADLSELSKVNAVPIKAEVTSKNSSDIRVDCSQVLKISLETMESKQIKVTVNCEGTPASGYSVGECVAKPNMIEVTGGESVIDRISTVEVNVNVNGASENFRKSVEPIAYDQKKHKITSATLSFNVSKVRASVRLLQKKEIPVNINIQGEPAEGYELLEVNSSPETIEVAGARKYLDEISEINIPVDISGMKADSDNLEQNFDLDQFINSHLSIPNEEEQNVSVKLSIQAMQTKTIELSVDQIKLKNVKSGYTASIISQTDKVYLNVRGKKDDLAGLSNNSFTGIVDCSGYREGNRSLPVEISLGSAFTLENEVKVKVSIKKDT